MDVTFGSHLALSLSIPVFPCPPSPPPEAGYDWVSEAESEDLFGTQEAEVPVDTLPTDGSMDLSDDVDL